MVFTCIFFFHMNNENKTKIKSLFRMNIVLILDQWQR